MAVLAVFGSSCWLLAVDVAGRVMSERWRAGGGVNPAHWLTRLALVDPRIAFKAGEQCVQSAADPQSCRGLFEQSLRGNSRLSGAEAALIVLAEQRRDLAAAGGALRRLRQRDRSFSARWLEWNFWLRNGVLERFREAAPGIARAAPAAFRGDFSLLLLAGADNREIVDAMLGARRSGRALDYTLFLAERGQPEAGELLAGLLHRADRHLAREAALRFVADRLRERRDLDQAVAVWAKSLKLGLVEDRRAAQTDGPVLNSNPRLRRPFVPRSFDWSAAENRWASMSQTSSGGTRIEIRYGAPPGIPLLSKALIAPERSTVVRVTMHLEETPQPEIREEASQPRAIWEVYDTQQERIVAKSSPGGEPCGPGCRQFDLPLDAGEGSRPVYMLLSVEAAARIAEPQIITISNICFGFFPPARSG